MADLRRALKEARPHFGSGGGGGGDGQAGWMRPGPGLAFRAFRPEVPALLGEVMDCLGKVRAVGMGGTTGGAMPPLVALLLQGPPGAGKVWDFVCSSSWFDIAITLIHKHTPNNHTTSPPRSPASARWPRSSRSGGASRPTTCWGSERRPPPTC